MTKTIKYGNLATIQVVDDGRIFQHGKELVKSLSHGQTREVVEALCDDGVKSVTVDVSRAVVFAFMPCGRTWNSLLGFKVDHKDCDTLNNNFYNLRWVSGGVYRQLEARINRLKQNIEKLETAARKDKRKQQRVHEIKATVAELESRMW